MSDDPDHDDTMAATEEPEAPPLAPLLALREPLTAVVDTPEALAATCEALAGGTGPVAIDAERASGYRYSSRAYLVQLRREGAATHLVDPIAFESLAPLAETLAGTEWILHAATQDLPCLAEIGLRPDALFDTELAGRLLGYPRVGLAALVELKLGLRMAKEHSAVDWSTRPLPQPWLEYAALDVEVLAELQALLVEELEEAGKTGWATEEFDALRDFKPTPRVDAWRRTSGLHKVRGRRSLGAVRALWQVRDEIAQERDVTPGRILPDTAIVAAATALPTHRRALLKTQGFHGRGAERYASRWVFALKEASELPEEELPARAPRGDGPPVPRAWAEKDPVAAKRLTVARAALADLAEEHHLPVENVLTPDHVRRLLWTPPGTRQPTSLADAVDQRLTEYGARAWQRHLTVPLLTEAILAAEPADDVAAATGPA
jgi:ribonuclease D